MRGSLANKSHVSRVFTSTGSLAENDLDTAESFNEYFASIFTLEDSDAPTIVPRSNGTLRKVVTSCMAF